MKIQNLSKSASIRAKAVRIVWGLLICLMLSDVGAEQRDARLPKVKERGFLTCGVRSNFAGFSQIDHNGNYAGLEVDLCRAISSAIFGVQNKVRFSEIDTVRQFLESPDIDIVFHGLTWTFAREAGSRFRFGPIYFYDGQSFLVSKKSRISSAKQLSGFTICVAAKHEMLSNLRHFTRMNRLAISELVMNNEEEAIAGFITGRCNSYSSDISQLASVLLSKRQNVKQHKVLPEIISKEPLAPIVRSGDEQFLDVVRWTIYATIAAEELEISSSSVDVMLKNGNSHVKSFLYMPEAERLGLEPNWAYHVIRNVGNYGEIFARNVGIASPVRLGRGLNNLWGTGGLLYAPPIP